jgi:outer membrane receptor protein involved in Fe transport
VTVNYKLDQVGWIKDLGGEDLGKEVYVTVQNLFDQLPPIVSDVNNPGLTPPTDRAKYDYVGRYVTLGLRVRM